MDFSWEEGLGLSWEEGRFNTHALGRQITAIVALFRQLLLQPLRRFSVPTSSQLCSGRKNFQHFFKPFPFFFFFSFFYFLSFFFFDNWKVGSSFSSLPPPQNSINSITFAVSKLGVVQVNQVRR